MSVLGAGMLGLSGRRRTQSEVTEGEMINGQTYIGSPLSQTECRDVVNVLCTPQVNYEYQAA